MTNPPAYRDGTLYVGLPFSDSLLPGGLLVAVDGGTGAVKWVFNSIPQGPRDAGWEISKDTWSSPGRYGGGIWTQPAIDAELGMIYFNAANPSPNYDGSSRKGMNLFTNSMLAVDLDTGELAWYFQTLHHDIWDWDLVAGPILFDIEVDGRPVKGIASLGKTCYVYMLDRATGEPLNPIVETAVPTVTDVPGEEVWPTQPIPYTAAGIPQQPFCATWPLITDPELKPRARQIFHPHSVNEFLIVAPGLMGGANFGSPSFSPRTGLLYATGKNDAWSIRVRPVGDTLEPGPGNMGHFAGFTEEGETGVTRRTTLAAYEPGTGRRAWYTEIDGMTNSGNLATAGDLVFQGAGTGHFYAFDAATGEQLFQYEAATGIPLESEHVRGRRRAVRHRDIGQHRAHVRPAVGEEIRCDLRCCVSLPARCCSWSCAPRWPRRAWCASWWSSAAPSPAAWSLGRSVRTSGSTGRCTWRWTRTIR